MNKLVLGVVAVGAIALIAFLMVPALTSATTVGGNVSVQFYNKDGTPIVPSFWERLFGGRYGFTREGVDVSTKFDGTVTITVAYTSGIDGTKNIVVVTKLTVTCRIQSPTAGVVATDSRTWTTDHGGARALVQSVTGSFDLLTLTKALTNPNADGWGITLLAELTATATSKEGQTVTATGTATFTFTVKYSSGTLSVSGAVGA